MNYYAESIRRFTTKEIVAAPRKVRPGKAPDFGGIHPEFPLYCKLKMKKWRQHLANLF